MDPVPPEEPPDITVSRLLAAYGRRRAVAMAVTLPIWALAALGALAAGYPEAALPLGIAFALTLALHLVTSVPAIRSGRRSEQRIAEWEAANSRSAEADDRRRD